MYEAATPNGQSWGPHFGTLTWRRSIYLARGVRFTNTSEAEAALRAELTDMKYSELEDLAESLGATDAQLEEIEDSEGSPLEELLSFVVSLKLKAQS